MNKKDRPKILGGIIIIVVVVLLLQQMQTRYEWKWFDDLQIWARTDMACFENNPMMGYLCMDFCIKTTSDTYQQCKDRINYTIMTSPNNEPIACLSQSCIVVVTGHIMNPTEYECKLLCPE